MAYNSSKLALTGIVFGLWSVCMHD